MDTARTILKKHGRLIFFITVIIGIFWLLYVLRAALLPFIVGLVLAYLLLPVISWAEKRLPYRGRWSQTKRVSLIILIFLLILALLGLFSFYIVTGIINAFIVLVNNAPNFIANGLLTLGDWVRVLREQFPPAMQQQIDEFILEASSEAGNAIKALFTTGISFIPSTFSLLLGFGALPIFLFFILKDSGRLSKSFYSAVPPWWAEHIKNILSIIENVLGRYIRAQLMLGLIVAYLCFVGLLILKIPFPAVLAAFAGFTELIPALGPWISGVTAVIVTLATVPEKAIWVVLLFLAVQLLENNLLVPRIHGSYLRIHPAILVVLLVVGSYIAGFWGMILAAPLTATVVEIYKYVHANVKENETESH